MKKVVLKTITLMLVVFIFSIGFSFKTLGYNSYTYSSYKSFSNAELVQSSGSVYLIGIQGANVQLDSIYPVHDSFRLTLEHNVYSYCFYSGCFVFICPDNHSTMTQVAIYDTNNDSFNSFYLNELVFCENTQLAFSDNCVYVADDYGNVRKYSDKGNLIHTYEVHYDRCHLMCDFYSTVYCVANNGIYEICNNEVYHICNCNIDAPAEFIDDNIFIDDEGCFYSFDYNRVYSTISRTSSVYSLSGGVYDNCIITADKNTLYAIDIDTDKVKRYIWLNADIEALCVVNNNIFALDYYQGVPSVAHIKYSDFNEVSATNNVTDSDDDNDSLTKDYSDVDISSDTYTIDYDNGWITDIEHGTTAAQFKRNMNYDGFSVSFERNDGKVIKSGNIGTGTIATFYNDDTSIEYLLSVKGDITGEGNMNLRDKRELFDCFHKSDTLSGIFCEAADVNNSNDVDTLDLYLLKRAVEYGISFEQQIK